MHTQILLATHILFVYLFLSLLHVYREIYFKESAHVIVKAIKFTVFLVCRSAA